MSTTLLQQGNFPLAAATSSRFAHSHKILRILSNTIHTVFGIRLAFVQDSSPTPHPTAKQIRRHDRERALFTSFASASLAQW